MLDSGDYFIIQALFRLPETRKRAFWRSMIAGLPLSAFALPSQDSLDAGTYKSSPSNAEHGSVVGATPVNPTAITGPTGLGSSPRREFIPAATGDVLPPTYQQDLQDGQEHQRRETARQAMAAQRVVVEAYKSAAPASSMIAGINPNTMGRKDICDDRNIRKAQTTAEIAAHLQDGVYFVYDDESPDGLGLIQRWKGKSWQMATRDAIKDDDWRSEGVTFIPVSLPSTPGYVNLKDGLNRAMQMIQDLVLSASKDADSKAIFAKGQASCPTPEPATFTNPASAASAAIESFRRGYFRGREVQADEAAVESSDIDATCSSIVDEMIDRSLPVSLAYEVAHRIATHLEQHAE